MGPIGGPPWKRPRLHWRVPAALLLLLLVLGVLATVAHAAAHVGRARRGGSRAEEEEAEPSMMRQIVSDAQEVAAGAYVTLIGALSSRRTLFQLPPTPAQAPVHCRSPPPGAVSVLDALHMAASPGPVLAPAQGSGSTGLDAPAAPGRPDALQEIGGGHPGPTAPFPGRSGAASHLRLPAARGGGHPARVGYLPQRTVCVRVHTLSHTGDTLAPCWRP